MFCKNKRRDIFFITNNCRMIRAMIGRKEKKNITAKRKQGYFF